MTVAAKDERTRLLYGRWTPQVDGWMSPNDLTAWRYDGRRYTLADALADQDRRDAYVQLVYERALQSSGSEGQARAAAEEARSMAAGNCGPGGLAIYQRWLDEQPATPPNDVRD